MQYLPLLATCPGTSIITVVILFLFILAFAFIIFKFGWLYIRAFASDVHVSFLQIVGMALRHVNARTII
ncbi:MAG: UPF0365 family protein, partial [Planctomycetota bacterium]